METGENCWDLQSGVNQETETMVNLFPAFVSSPWEIFRFHNFMATSIFFLQIPWTLISMSLCLFVEVRPDAWEILEISAISASYSHIRVVRTIWIRTHTDTRRYTGTYAHICTYEVHIGTLLLSYGCDSSVGRWSSSDKMGSWPYFTFGWWLSLYLCVYPNMYFCVASTLYLVGAQFKVISQGDRISGRTHMELMRLPFASGKWFMWPTNWILHQLYF